MSKKGKQQAKCKRYKDFGRREENKRAKLKKHLEKHPEDKDAKKALASVSGK